MSNTGSYCHMESVSLSRWSIALTIHDAAADIICHAFHRYLRTLRFLFSADADAWPIVIPVPASL
ncbi:unnamed protein product [Mycena citricolor]|uniref:Uncharacterized protein n=1 Tax=Mycena citricolor TaxID=2018698 RepID=A0AAD2Q758_9AGAR|nr:unnamed protein product [Mycena citricolor]